MLTLFLVKVLISFLSFKRILNIFHLVPVTSGVCSVDEKVYSEAERELCFLERVANALPLHYTCLMRCIAYCILADQMTARVLTIHIGVGKEHLKLQAHAWACIGGKVIIQEKHANSFNEIAIFQKKIE